MIYRVLFALLLLSSFARATTYYVDCAAADDTQDGQAQTIGGGHGPWKTITKVNATAQSGDDFVLLKRGCTFSGVQLTPSTSGTSGHPITFGNYGAGALPIITGVAFPVRISAKNYITVTQIATPAATNTGVYISNCTGCIVDGVVVAGWTTSAIFVDGVSPNLKVLNSTATATSTSCNTSGTVIMDDSITTDAEIAFNTVDTTLCDVSTHPSGILTRDVQNPLVHDNTVSMKTGVQALGIKTLFVGVSGAKVYNNYVPSGPDHSASCVGCDGESLEITGTSKTGTVNVTSAANSVVTWVSGPTFFAAQAGKLFNIAGVDYTVLSFTDSTHLVLTTNAGTQTGATYIYWMLVDGVEIYNNSLAGGYLDSIGIVVARNAVIHHNTLIAGPAFAEAGTHYGIHLTGGLLDCITITGTHLIYNNSIYGQADTGISVSCSSTATNNIVSNAAGHGIFYGASANGTWDYNLIYNSGANSTVWGTNGGHNSIGSTSGFDPKFTNSAPTIPADFRLLATSPAIDTGTNIGSYNLGLDPRGATMPFATLDQNAYGADWDKGAFVFYVAPVGSGSNKWGGTLGGGFTVK